MNRIFKSVWNQELRAWVAVSELTRACGKRCSVALIPAVLLGLSSTAGAQVSVTGDYVAGTLFAASPWAAGQLQIGVTGAGTLDVQAGGLVTSQGGTLGRDAGSNGRATVSGAGAAWNDIGPGNMTIGDNGTGSLSVLNGGKVDVRGGTPIGTVAGSSGSLLVDGAGSAFNSVSHMYVGWSGAGAITVSNGGKVSNARGYLGYESGSGTGLVTGSGSTWAHSQYFYVGRNGAGKLDILDGGLVTSATGGAIGSGVGAGAVTISGVAADGTASRWTSNSFFVIGLGTTGGQVNKLNVLDGGQMVVAGANSLMSTNVDVQSEAVISGVNGTHRSSWTNTGNFTAGFAGQARVTVADGALLSSSIGVIGGAATANGTVTVQGVNGTNHSSWINTGTLTIGESGTGALNVLDGGQVTGMTGLVLLGRDPGATGTLTVDGVGSLLSGTGALNVGAAGSGTMTVANGGQVSAASLGIAVAGGSTGVVNIGTGGQAGTLDLPTVTFGAGTGTLNFNHNSSSGYDFGAVLSSGMGTATVNQLAGNTNLTGNSGGFGGTTNVTGGTLRVNGTLGNAASTLAVSNGATLGGTGTIGGAVNIAGGVLSPGNGGIGALTIQGNYAQAGGSVYQVQVDPGSNASDHVQVAGSANIGAGAGLQVSRLNAANYTLGTQYKVLTAAGGVTGTYSLSGDTGSAFVQLFDTYDANNVYLTPQQVRSFTDAGRTPNQIATAGGLDTLGGGSPLRNVLAFLPSEAAAQSAFDQLSGEAHASAKTALLEDSRFVREAATGRLLSADCATGANDPRRPSAAAASTDAACVSSKEPTVWAQGFGATGHVEGDGNAARLRRDIGGVFVGADTLVGGDWRVGGLGGYSRSDIDIDARNASAKVDTYTLGIYGGKQWGATGVRLGASHSWHKLDMQRNVAFQGFSDSLNARYNAATTQVFGEVGHRVAVSEQFAIEPFAGLAFVSVKTDGFTERGGLAALTSAGDTTDATFSTLGARLTSQLSPDTRLRGLIGWRHVFGSTTPSSRMAFAGSQPFTVQGVPLARNLAVVEAGVETKIGPDLHLSVSYSGQFGSGVKDNGLRLTLAKTF